MPATQMGTRLPTTDHMIRGVLSGEPRCGEAVTSQRARRLHAVAFAFLSAVRDAANSWLRGMWDGQT